MNAIEKVTEKYNSMLNSDDIFKQLESYSMKSIKSIKSDILTVFILLVMIGVSSFVFAILFLAQLIVNVIAWFGRKLDNYLDKKADKLFDRPDE